MTVTNIESGEDGEHYVEVIRDKSSYTFVFVERGHSGAVLKSMMVDGYSLAPRDGRTKIESYGEASRFLEDSVDHIEDTFIPSKATVVFDNE